MKKFAGALILLIVGALLSCPNPVSSPVDPASSPAKAWVVSTFVGNTGGFRDGAGTSAEFDLPVGVAVDSSGNLYVADRSNNRIRKITPAGEVSTFAGSTEGSADGAGTAAQFNGPIDVAVDASGNLYVADSYNHLIRKITATGEVSTLAGSTRGFRDGDGTAAQFNDPAGVAVDAEGNVYVVDRSNHRIRKITATGEVSTLAGNTWGLRNGTGTAAQFNNPHGVTTDSSGNLYVADSLNNRIRKITATGEVSTFAGSTEDFRNGAGIEAQFDFPSGVTVDAEGSVYVTDYFNHRIRKITATGEMSILAGAGTSGSADGAGTAAQFYSPTGVTADSSGNVYVADLGNHRIRKITATGEVSTLAGSTRGFRDGDGTAAEFDGPAGVAVDSADNVYVADLGNHRIRKITPEGLVSTLAGSTEGFRDGAGTTAQFKYPTDVAVDAAGNVYVADASNHRIRLITATGEVSTLAGTGRVGSTNGAGTAAEFDEPVGVAVDSSGNLYVADYGNHRIRRITPTGEMSTLAGSTEGFRDGAGIEAQFDFPSGVTVDAEGNVYVTDYFNHLIRKITATGEMSFLAGAGTSGSADGVGTAAQFYSPTGVTADSSGNLYVADYGNHRIRKITATGEMSTLAGSTEGSADGAGTTAQFNGPIDVAVDAEGNVYVTVYGNHRIRRITLTGEVSTLAGSGTTDKGIPGGGFRDGVGTTAQFNGPIDVVVDSEGNVYVADYHNHLIRKIEYRLP